METIYHHLLGSLCTEPSNCHAYLTVISLITFLWQTFLWFFSFFSFLFNNFLPKWKRKIAILLLFIKLAKLIYNHSFRQLSFLSSFLMQNLNEKIYFTMQPSVPTLFFIYCSSPSLLDGSFSMSPTLSLQQTFLVGKCCLAIQQLLLNFKT